MTEGIARCDNTSVGLILKDRRDRIALLTRRRPPLGVAIVAGHCDGLSPRDAVIKEAPEEIGLLVARTALLTTPIQGRSFPNQCQRPGGYYHQWWVFEATDFTGSLKPSPTETKGASWHDQDQLEALAERTRALNGGGISQVAREANPGLEPIMLEILTELGYLALR